MKPRLFYSIVVEVIESGEQKMKLLFEAIFVCVGKETWSLCSREVSLMREKVLTIVRHQKLLLNDEILSFLL